ncbi:MAG: glycosyltransferase family 1 protein [Pseudomonadota bacterium]
MEKLPVPKRLFFDVTDLRGHLQQGARVSGIQRVALMVIDHLRDLVGPETEIWLAYAPNRSNKYLAVQVTSPGLEPRVHGDPTAFAAMLGVEASDDASLPSMQKYRTGSHKFRTHRAIRDLNAALGREEHFRKRGTTLTEWKNARVQVMQPQTSTHEVDKLLQKGDDIIVLGAFWGSAAREAALARLSTQGARVTLLIHDMIPVERPDFVAGAHGFIFFNSLQRSLAYVNCYLANSHYTATDLARFLNQAAPERPLRLLQLAQDGVGETKVALSEAADLYPDLTTIKHLGETVKTIAKYPFVLCVGTWDTRKNLWRILQAWARLAERAVPDLPKLVLAGGPGWGSDDADRYLKTSGQLGGWVEVVENISDAELAFLYRRCQFTVMLSLYEGWGLPIGESLAYGKTAIVSDCSSLPEVGGDLVLYCDPERIESIASAVEELVCNPARRVELEVAISAASLRRWPDVAHDLLETLTRSDEL